MQLKINSNRLSILPFPHIYCSGTNYSTFVHSSPPSLISCLPVIVGLASHYLVSLNQNSDPRAKGKVNASLNQRPVIKYDNKVVNKTQETLEKLNHDDSARQTKPVTQWLHDWEQKWQRMTRDAEPTGKNP